jgi:hypothetical protein
VIERGKVGFVEVDLDALTDHEVFALAIERNVVVIDRRVVGDQQTEISTLNAIPTDRLGQSLIVQAPNATMASNVGPSSSTCPKSQIRLKYRNTECIVDKR